MSGSVDESLSFFAGGATCTGEADRDFFTIIELFNEGDTFSDVLLALGSAEPLTAEL